MIHRTTVMCRHQCISQYEFGQLKLKALHCLLTTLISDVFFCCLLYYCHHVKRRKIQARAKGQFTFCYIAAPTEAQTVTHFARYPSCPTKDLAP